MFDEEKLILEVQEHRVLYDSTHQFYKDTYRKENAWCKVAEVVGISADDCKTKWRALRDSFVKYNKKKGSGAMGGQVKEWKHERTMSFITPYVIPRSSKKTLAPAAEVVIKTEEDDQPSSPQSPQGQDETAPLSSPATSAHSPTPSLTATERKRPARSRSPRERASTSTAPRQTTRARRAAVPDVDLGDRLVSILENPAPRPHLPLGKGDLIHHFVLSLESILNELDPDLLRRAKTDILNIVHDYQAEQEQRLRLRQQQQQQQQQ